MATEQSRRTDVGLPLAEQYAGIVGGFDAWVSANRRLFESPMTVGGIFTTEEGGSLDVAVGTAEATIKHTLGDVVSRVIINRKTGQEGLNYKQSPVGHEESWDPAVVRFGFWKKVETPGMVLMHPNLTHPQVFEGAQSLVGKLPTAKRVVKST